MTDFQPNLDKTFDAVQESMEKMWDMWLTNFNNLAWTQSQMEDMARKQLDQNKSARDNALKMVEEMNRQARKNQEQFWKMAEGMFGDTFEQMISVNKSLMGDLPSRMEEMAKKAGWNVYPLFKVDKAV